MKKLLAFVLILAFSAPVFADCENSCKCSDLISDMYNRREALFNVLNLTKDQKKCKETIDKKYQENSTQKFAKYEEEKFVLDNMTKHGASQSALRKQENIVINQQKELLKMNDNYDKELKSILNREQKEKLNTIRQMEKRALKYCSKNKAFYKRDENVRIFGEAN